MIADLTPRFWLHSLSTAATIVDELNHDAHAIASLSPGHRQALLEQVRRLQRGLSPLELTTIVVAQRVDGPSTASLPGLRVG